MKIVKENYNEMLNLVANAIVNSDYNDECFSNSDLELNGFVWAEATNVFDELKLAGINFKKFVLPITNAYNIELNGSRLNETLEANTSDDFPENLNISVECPYIESVYEWAHGGVKPTDICRAKVIDNN